MQKTSIAVSTGDGIGPEIVKVTLDILEKAGARLQIHPIEIGPSISEQAWKIIKECKVLLKAPITTPQGGGFKSLNVTLRTSLGLYANVRPCISYFPYIATKHPEVDVVIVRENEEDLYTGVEYRQTPDVCTATKIISRVGSEKIIRYAFEYAKKNGRKKVSLFMKDNILKLTDGLFHQVFDQIAMEYPDILNDSWIVDIGTARLADTPEIFDVIVLPNLYGDILSDVAAQIAGSVGLAGSANIGDHAAMFEAIHGSAPKIAGKNIANPSGLILAATQMLDHIGQSEIGSKIHNAWSYTLEQGIHTPDIFKEGKSKEKMGTIEFGERVIQNLGKAPSFLKAATFGSHKQTKTLPFTPTTPKRALVGVDVYIYHRGELSDFFAKISHINMKEVRLKLITNRGVTVWPNGQKETCCVEQWCCRFLTDETHGVSQSDILQILHAFDHMGLDIIRSECLYLFK